MLPSENADPHNISIGSGRGFKATKNDVFVNGSDKANPIDSGHEMMDNLLDDVGRR